MTTNRKRIIFVILGILVIVALIWSASTFTPKDFTNVTVNSPMFTACDGSENFISKVDLTDPKNGFVVKDGDDELTPYEDYVVEYRPHDATDGNCPHKPIYTKKKKDGTVVEHYGQSMFDAVVVGTAGSTYEGLKLYTEFVCVDTGIDKDATSTIPYYGTEYELKDKNINYSNKVDVTQEVVIEYASKLDAESWSKTIPTATDPGEYHTFSKCSIDGEVVDYGYASMTIEGFDLANACLDEDVFTYDGVAKKPKLCAEESENKELIPLVVDYLKIEYFYNTDAGIATVKVSPKDSLDEHYHGTKTLTFTILSKDIKTLSVPRIPDGNYDGTPLKPEFTIKDGPIKLELNKDYVAEYVNNVEVGTATVTIHGIGNYTGTKVKTFKILAPEN